MPNLLDIATLLQFMPGMAKASAEQQASLDFLISVVSADFLRATNRPDLLSADYTEIREGDGGAYLNMRHWPITAVASVRVAGATVVALSENAGFYVDTTIDPERARQIFLAGSTFTDAAIVTVQYTAGYVDVPADIQGAVADWVAARYQQRQFAGIKTTQAADRERADPTDESVPPNTLRVIEKYTRVQPSLERREQRAAPPSEAKARA